MRLSSPLWAAMCWLALLPSVRAAAPEVLELSLGVGEQQVIPSKHVVSFSEGIDGIVDVRLMPEGERFVVVGLKRGETTLLLVLEDGSTRLYRIAVIDLAAPQPTDTSGVVVERNNIRLDFFFVQLEAKSDRDMGIRWPTELGAGSFAGGYDFIARALTPTTAVVSTALMPKLELAESRGWAKILRRSSVITASGTSAVFSSGGEINIPVFSAVSTGLQVLSYGSKVKVAPRYDEESGRIELVIEASVAELDMSPGSEVPGRITADLNTLVNMELGQSLVLAGLSAQSEARSHGGVPGLSQIPILGGLFGKHAYRSDHTENVIYIIPSLIEATQSQLREELRRALDAYTAFEGEQPPTLRPGGGQP